MIDNDVRSKIRSQIRPFPRVATYPTGWAGQRTFEQIYDDLIPSFNRLCATIATTSWTFPT